MLSDASAIGGGALRWSHSRYSVNADAAVSCVCASDCCNVANSAKKASAARASGLAPARVRARLIRVAHWASMAGGRMIVRGTADHDRLPIGHHDHTHVNVDDEGADRDEGSHDVHENGDLAHD